MSSITPDGYILPSKYDASRIVQLYETNYAPHLRLRIWYEKEIDNVRFEVESIGEDVRLIHDDYFVLSKALWHELGIISNISLGELFGLKK